MKPKEHGYRILFPKDENLIERNEKIYFKRSNGQSLQSIADEFGISRERVRQIFTVRERYEQNK
tara:strand:+ start:3017 stop:3208 length:192 start_codon:yes stop_codon:yes gene_type:complete